MSPYAERLCFTCLKPFVAPDRRLYCNVNCIPQKQSFPSRKRRPKHLDRFYTRHGFDSLRQYTLSDGSSVEGRACYYCGDIATEYDHVLPLIVVEELYTAGYAFPSHLLLIVPACRECNGILSDQVFPTLKQRKGHVKQQLQQIYWRLQNIAPGDPNESKKLQLWERLSW